MIIYTMLSEKCDECERCRHGMTCRTQVERMTTDPGCPTHATITSPRRRAAGRVAYRYANAYDNRWSYSCLTPAREQGCNFDAGALIDDGSDEAAIAWLMGEGE